MNRYRIDTSGISKMFELTKSGRMRKVARLWYVNKMDIEDIAKALGYGKSVVVSEIMVINRLIENNISCKTCSQCGETFYTGQKGTQICPKCKEQNAKDRLEVQKEEYKSSNKQRQLWQNAKNSNLYRLSKKKEPYIIKSIILY